MLQISYILVVSYPDAVGRQVGTWLDDAAASTGRIRWRFWRR